MAKQQFSQDWGSMEMVWGQNSTGEMKLNRLAHSASNELLMVSLVTEQIRVKQLRAALASSAGTPLKMGIYVSDCKTKIKDCEVWTGRTPGKLHLSAEGYFVHSQKLGYGLAHCVLVSKTPGFMMIITDEAVWRELNTARFTTPLLREWVPYIANQLRDIGRLSDALTYNCQCGVLAASTAKLDEVVVAGIIAGAISISGPIPAASAA